MGIVRVGARPEDVSYETGATKLAQSLGIAVSRTLLPGDVGERQLLEALREVNENQRIHGCLLFRPLPPHLNTRAVLGALSPEKDIDAMTGASMAVSYTHLDVYKRQGSCRGRRCRRSTGSPCRP